MGYVYLYGKCGRAPFYEHWVTLIPAWIGKHMPSKVCDENIYPYPNFNCCTLEVWGWIRNFIPHFIVDVYVLSMLGLKLINESCLYMWVPSKPSVMILQYNHLHWWRCSIFRSFFRSRFQYIRWRRYSTQHLSRCSKRDMFYPPIH